MEDIWEYKICPGDTCQKEVRCKVYKDNVVTKIWECEKGHQFERTTGVGKLGKIVVGSLIGGLLFGGLGGLFGGGLFGGDGGSSE